MGGAAPPPTTPLFLKATHACHCASFDIISLFPDFFTIFIIACKKIRGSKSDDSYRDGDADPRDPSDC